MESLEWIISEINVQDALSPEMKKSFQGLASAIKIGKKIGNSDLQTAMTSAVSVFPVLLSGAIASVPIVGIALGITSSLITANIGKGAAAGAGSTDWNERSEFCRTHYRPVVPSGPGGETLPCDWFRYSKNPHNLSDGVLSPSVGFFMKAILSRASEPTAKMVTATQNVLPINPLWTALLLGYEPGVAARPGIANAKGLSARKIKLYLEVCEKIGEQFMKPGSDGGTYLGTLLLDMLQKDMSVGNLTPEFCAWLANSVSPKINKSVRDNDLETSCLYHDPRGLVEFMALVSNYKRSIASPYKTEQQRLRFDFAPQQGQPTVIRRIAGVAAVAAVPFFIINPAAGAVAFSWIKANAIGLISLLKGF